MVTTATITTEEYDRLKEIEFNYNLFINDVDDQIIFTIPDNYNDEGFKVRVYKGSKAMAFFKEEVIDTYVYDLNRLKENEEKRVKELERLKSLLDELKTIKL